MHEPGVIMAEILFCALVVVAGLMWFHSRKREPWVGRRVMLKYTGINFGQTNADGLDVLSGQLDTAWVLVTAAKDGWLRTTFRGKSGWFPQDYAVVLEEAPAYFGDLIRQQPDMAFAWAGRGIAWYMLGKNDQSVADLTEAIRLNPAGWPHFWWRGTARWWGRHFAQAEADFTEVIRLAPEVAQGYSGRASVAVALFQFDRALPDADAAVRIDPTDATSWNLRGSVWLGKGEYDRALADLDEAVRLDPTYPFAHVNRGSVWLGKGDHERARREFDEAVSLDSSTALCLIARGQLRHLRDDLHGAVADFTAALHVDPSSAAAYVQRGFARAVLKQHILALADFGMATRRDPRNAHAPAGEALVWAARKDYAQAQAALDKARELGPDDHGVLNAWAWFQATCPDAKYRDWTQAVANATRACEQTYWNADGHIDTLAAAYAEAGDFAQAVHFQKRVLESRMLPESMRTKALARLALYEQGKPYRE
jgi:tetratricopeptide (TPR) repeat protein